MKTLNANTSRKWLLSYIGVSMQCSLRITAATDQCSTVDGFRINKELQGLSVMYQSYRLPSVHKTSFQVVTFGTIPRRTYVWHDTEVDLKRSIEK